MMKVAFLGYFTPLEKLEEFKQKSRIFDIPANVLSYALIRGFDALTDLRIITSPNLRGYSDGKVQSFEFSHNGKSKDYCVGFREIPLIREISVAKEVLSDLDKCEPLDVIFLYSIKLPLIYAAYKYKKAHPDIKIVEMVTDLPGFMRERSSLLYKVAKTLETSIVYRLMTAVDGFALLSLHMAEKLPINGKPVVQVEGIFDNTEEPFRGQYQRKKTILYSGKLEKRYGLIDLLNAFVKSRVDYQLVICGYGDATGEVKTYSARDSRIVFLGSLTREEVLCLQRESALLINPRHKSEEFTKYSFPSKTMEYMASGTPTLMSELKSLPEEYKKYLLFFDDESIEGMAAKIEEICSKTQSELDSLGKKASEFILKNKNPEAQVKRMLDALIGV